MKKYLILFILIITSLCYSGELYQLGTIDSMMKGYYEKVRDVSEVKAFATMGLGTTTALGEVIGVDGKYYMADSSGNIKQMIGKTQLPYLTCALFEPEKSFKLDSPFDNSKDFYAFIEKNYLKSNNIFYAIRVDGLFQKVDARSEDSFTGKPEPLAQWLKTHQKSFVFNNIQGTLVIFKYPLYMNGIGVAPYHAHFISENRKVGGHVFDFALSKGKVSFETYYQLTLILPKTDKFVKADFGAVSEETKKSIDKIETNQD